MFNDGFGLSYRLFWIRKVGNRTIKISMHEIPVTMYISRARARARGLGEE